MNPFVQGWSAPQPPIHEPTSLPTWGTRPSIRGALPYTTSDPSSAQALVSFNFTSYDGTILNSALVGSDCRQYFHITTDASTSWRTVVQDSTRRVVAIVSWRPHPAIVIAGAGSATRRTSQWMCLSPDKTCRILKAGGLPCVWRPNGGCIELQSADSEMDAQFFARISQHPEGTVLQLTLEAIQRRLLQVVVISAVLLMSGRNID